MEFQNCVCILCTHLTTSFTFVTFFVENETGLVHVHLVSVSAGLAEHETKKFATKLFYYSKYLANHESRLVYVYITCAS